MRTQRPFITTVQNPQEAGGAQLLCSAARKLSNSSAFPRAPRSPVWVRGLSVLPLSQTNLSPSHLYVLPGDDNSLSRLGWETGFELLGSVKCLGVLSPCSPQLPGGILTLLQLEPPSSVFPGHGHLLEHLARGAFCSPLFLSGLLLSFLNLSICLSGCVRSELRHTWESVVHGLPPNCSA